MPRDDELGWTIPKQQRDGLGQQDTPKHQKASKKYIDWFDELEIEESSIDIGS